MTNGNDFIQTTTYRQVGDNDFRIATERDIQEGMFLSTKGGLTKREYFAAMTMQGMLANSIDTSQVAKPYHHMRYEELAQNSASAADALIKALNKTP